MLLAIGVLLAVGVTWIVLRSSATEPVAVSTLTEPSEQRALPLVDSSLDVRGAQDLVPAVPETIARLTVQVTGLHFPLELDPPLQASLEPAGDTGVSFASQSVTAPAPATNGVIRLVADPGSWELRTGTLPGLVASRRLELPAGEHAVEVDASRSPGFVGAVRDPHGRAIAGAQLILSIWSGVSTAAIAPLEGATEVAGPVFGYHKRPARTLRTVARSDGSFTLPFLHADEVYEVSVSAPGYRTEGLGPLVPEGARLAVLPDIVLGAGRVVSGRIVDESDRPVAACRVQVAPPGGRPEVSGTDRDGRFRFPSVAVGPMRVWTNSREAVNDGKELPAAGDVDVTLVLRSGVWVDVHVVEADGADVGGVGVWGFQVHDGDASLLGSSLARHRQEFTGEDGRARLGPFAPGTVRVLEPTRSMQEWIVQAPSTLGITLPALVEHDLVFAFRDEREDTPVTSQGVAHARREGAGNSAHGSEAAVHPDRHGLWSWQRQLPGELPLTFDFSFPGYRMARVANLPSRVSEESPVEVRLLREDGLAVKVTAADGSPLAGADVVLQWGLDADELRRVTGAGSSGVKHGAFPGRSNQAAARVEARTRADGRASFARHGDGPLAWLVTLSGHVPALGELSTLRPAEDFPELEVRLLAVPSGDDHR